MDFIQKGQGSGPCSHLKTQSKIFHFMHDYFTLQYITLYCNINHSIAKLKRA